jgi:hypothetical protein
MKKSSTLIFLLIAVSTFAQNKTPEDFGYRYISLYYKKDRVDMLIKSKKGEENVNKPIFFFCQGSLPQPLIKYEGKSAYGVFPFNPDSLSEKYHLAIVGKPYIPVIADIATLSNNFTYVDSAGKFVKEYTDRNLLSYYVDRNLSIINYLQKQKWVSSSQLIVAGHSEGATIAAKMASKSKKITHLIYSGGNPMGRIMTIITQNRANESYTDTTSAGEQEINYWKEVVKNKTDMDGTYGDTHKATFEFSDPPITYLSKLNIPVLVTYGTKDWCAPFVDFMRVDFIRRNKQNFSFLPYVGTEHNFFPLTADNKPNYDIFNWDNVANDWLDWIRKK